MTSLTDRQANTRFLIVLLIVLSAIILGYGLMACSSDSPGSSDAPRPAESEEASTGAVTLTIDTTAVGGGAAESVEVSISEGDTVYDALERSGIDFTAEDTQYGRYIASINGLAQGDEGTMSGWLFSINGVAAQASPDNSDVQDGDTITWYYSVDGTMPE